MALDTDSQPVASDERPHRAQVEELPDVPPASVGKALFIVGVFIVILFIAGVLTFVARSKQNRVLAKDTENNAVPIVAVVHPTAENPDEDLVLPGTLQAFTESPIYARTNGYLVRWYKDIGSGVKQGDLLAKLDTPEVDQELLQARAAQQQTQAQLELAKISADRWQNLRRTDSVSQQEADQQASGYKQSIANVAASDANVKRLEQLESFKNVYAPFSGVLTKRNVDPGALINAGSSGREMFDIAQVDPLRMYVNVPQAYAPSIKRGMTAWVTLQEFSGQKFKGLVARTSDSIDPATRTLLTEVDVPNKDGRLLSGSFGEARFVLSTSVKRMVIPVNAMLFRAEGARVAVVNQGKIELRPLTIGRDYGTTLEVLGGIEMEDNIVVNPSDSLEQGQEVRIASPEKGNNSGANRS